MVDESQAPQLRVSVSEEAKTAIPRLANDAKAYREEDLKEAARIAESFTTLNDRRIAFFEKIILLAGGSFALSLTLLSSLQHQDSGSHVQAISSLEASWILLLGCIFLSWLHNRHRAALIEAVTFATHAQFKTYRQTQFTNLMARAARGFQGFEVTGIDWDAFFTAVSKATQKSAEDSDKIREQMVQAAQTSWRIAKLVGDWAQLAIALAFALMLIFAMNNARLL